MYPVINLNPIFTRLCYNPRSRPDSANLSSMAKNGYTQISYIHSNSGPIEADSVIIVLFTIGK